MRLRPNRDTRLADNEKLLIQWQDAWAEALALWSRYTQLREPALCATQVAAGKLGVKSGEGFYDHSHGTKELIVAGNFS